MVLTVSKRGLDIKTLVRVKGYDLMKERNQTISISVEEMFDNMKIVERLSSQENLSQDEQFLIDVIKMADVCKYEDDELYTRCSAIIETLVNVSLDSNVSSSEDGNAGA